MTVRVLWCCSPCFLVQDKSSNTVVHSVRALIGDGDDILLINIGSGVNAVHLASLTVNSATTIFGLGVHTERQLRLIRENVERMGASGRTGVASIRSTCSLSKCASFCFSINYFGGDDDEVTNTMVMMTIMMMMMMTMTITMMMMMMMMMMTITMM